jgi:AcrR family transcriptional regulator
VTDTGDWRSRRWGATHQRIYDVALQLFVQHGYEQVHVGQIAKAAEVSVPTFYAHYPSKEHLVMQLPTADDVAGLLTAQPPDLPLRERIRSAVHSFFAQWDDEMMRAHLVRWRLIVTTPSLRRRAAEFERATAQLLAGAMPGEIGGTPGSRESVLINAYLSALTSGAIAWAESEGARPIVEFVDEAFEAIEALQRR